MSLLDSAHDETKINCSELKKNNLISFEFLKNHLLNFLLYLIYFVMLENYKNLSNELNILLYNK